MKLLGKSLTVGTGLLLGIGLALLAPMLVKLTRRGGLKEAFAGMRESLDDLKAEVRAELAQEKKGAALVEAFCVRCKQRVIVRNPRITRTKTNWKMIWGLCSSCGGRVSTFLA